MFYSIRKFRSPDDTTTATGAGTNPGDGTSAQGGTPPPAQANTGGQTPQTPTQGDADKEQEKAVRAAMELLVKSGLNVLSAEQMKERLDKQDASTRKALEAEAKKQAQAQLKEQGDLQTLTNQLQADLKAEQEKNTALLSEKDQSDTANKTYTDFINKYIESDVKEWPDALKEFDPGKENLPARMAWWEKGKKHAETFKLPPSPKNPRGPQPGGPPADEAAARLPQSVLYKGY